MKPVSSSTSRRGAVTSLALLAAIAATAFTLPSARAGTVIIPGSGIAPGGAAVVVSGLNNNATGFASGIFTGFNHVATGNGVASTILTGIGNTMNARNSYIGCGNSHSLNGTGASTILAGIGNTIDGTGDSSAIITGTGNTLGGANSVVAGAGVNALSSNSFTFGTNIGSTAGATGVVHFGDSDPFGVRAGGGGLINVGLADTFFTTFNGGYQLYTDDGQGGSLAGLFLRPSVVNNAVSGSPAHVGINKISAAAPLDIFSLNDIGAGNPILITGNFAGTHLQYDGNEIQAFSSSTASSLDLNAAGAPVVIGRNSQTTQNGLTVVGLGNGGSTTPPAGNHVAHFRSSQGANSCVLALQVGDSNPTDPDNFITFFNNAGGIMGAIDALNSTTVTYKTSGADFAEVLPMAADATRGEANEIVPVRHGEIGDWNRAEHYMIVSDRAGFLGNQGAEKPGGRHHTIAFLGQVPVKVRGAVNSGDYILASENDDGTGVARRAERITVAEMHRVVGRAWESSSEEGLKKVNTAVGLDQTSLVIPALERLERENEELKTRLAKLEKFLEKAAE